MPTRPPRGTTWPALDELSFQPLKAMFHHFLPDSSHIAGVGPSITRLIRARLRASALRAVGASAAEGPQDLATIGGLCHWLAVRLSTVP